MTLSRVHVFGYGQDHDIVVLWQEGSALIHDSCDGKGRATIQKEEVAMTTRAFSA